MKNAFLLVTLFVTCVCFAQTSNVTATITDSDSQVWNNGTYTINFVPTPGKPGPYTCNGSSFNQGPFTGSLSNSGVLTISLTDNGCVAPAGSQWQFVICPNASSPCGNKNLSVTGPSPNLSSALSASVPVVRFPAINQAYGYSDAEVTPTPHPGGSYWNVSTGCLRLWSGTVWGCSTGTILDNHSPPVWGDVTANYVGADPLVVTSGSSGDSNWNAFKISGQTATKTKGEFDFDWIKSDGSLNVRSTYFLPWFKPDGNFSQGIIYHTEPESFFLLIGGLVDEGIYNSYNIHDPSSTPCSITHNGAGGSGVTYYIRYVDANSGVSLVAPACTDSSGYAANEIDTTHYNTVQWWQLQDPSFGNGGGGGYSNMILARGAYPANINDILTATGACTLHSDCRGPINTPGHSAAGVLSTFSACGFKGTPSGDSSCTFVDNDTTTYTTINLSTLMGAFWHGQDDNTTSDMHVGGSFYTFHGNYLASGTQQFGRFLTTGYTDLAAPNVTVNTTGSSTIYYAAIGHDSALGQTALTNYTVVSNSAATPNNTVALTVACYPAFQRVDILVSTDHINWNSMGGNYPSGSLGIPCYTSNQITIPSFTDTNQTRSSYTSTGPNTTADIYSSNNITAYGTMYTNFGIASSNYSAPFVFGSDGNTGHGNVALASGDSTHTGGIEFRRSDGTQSWNIGFSTDDSLDFTPLTSGKVNVNAAAGLLINNYPATSVSTTPTVNTAVCWKDVTNKILGYCSTALSGSPPTCTCN